MASRCSGAVRLVPLLLLVVIALSLPAYAQAPASKHFPNDRSDVGCAVLPHNVPLLGAGTFHNIPMSVSYGRNPPPDLLFALSTMCSNPLPAAGGDAEPIAQGGWPCSAGVNCIAPSVCTTQIKALSCFTGDDEVRRGAKAFCYQAVAQPAKYLVTVYNPLPSSPATNADCAGLANGVAAQIDIRDLTWTGGGFCGFTINKDGPPHANPNTPPATHTGLHFSVLAGSNGACRYNGILHAGAGQTINTDMLNHYYVQVDPQGVTSGSINFDIAKLGGTQCSFSVPLPNPVNNVTLHNNIRAGFQGCGVSAQVHTTPGNSESAFKSSYNSGIPLVFVPNAKTSLYQVQVTGPENVLITDDTSNSALGIPALNPWGVGLLAAVLLLSSLWFLRRRTHPREA